MTRGLIYCFLLLCHQVYSQRTSIDQILDSAPRKAIAAFASEQANDKDPQLEMYYASSRPKGHIDELEILRPVIKVRLYYSAFPPGNELDQRSLNRSRIALLTNRFPSLLSLPLASWELIEQNACTSEAEARRLFHGFVLELAKGADVPDFLEEAELLALTEGDSTLFKIVERQKDWSEMLVVTDLTASMAPYTAQLLIWFKLNDAKKLVRHFVFFNDGDDKTTVEKVIGQTGGIYAGPAATFEEAAGLAQQAIENGYGGDLPENNLEALIKGIEACPDCREVVMIADNTASPRDMALLPEVGRPIRMILCGTELGVNPDYLNIALKTGGSIHTIEEDIDNLVKISEGESITIGKEVFIIKDGEFRFFKKI